MSQKHPHRDRDRAAQQRRQKASEAKKAKKDRRVDLREKRESK